MMSRCCLAFVIFCCLCTVISADDKKEMIVVAGQSAQQVNNHPWTYTTPGHANTTCSGSGTVNATATDAGYGTTNVNGTVYTNNDCNTTSTPSQTVNGNRITVNNASWVTDVATGDQYLIQCTAGWVGSKCSYLNSGRYKAELQGNNMRIAGMKGMKEMTAKYHVLRYVPNHYASTPSATTVSASSSSSPSGAGLSADETYAWLMYRNSLPEDKDYVQVYCSANPKGAALLPRSKIAAGQGAEHALDCASWTSAKSKEQ
jgi:hypothetical protein